MKKQILVLPFLLMIAVCFQSAKAQNLITGRVVDATTGNYLKNAFVQKVGTDFQTVTNDFGFFQVEVSGPTKLQISCEEYATVEIQISGKGNVKIEMARSPSLGAKPLPVTPTFPGGLPALYEYLGKNMRVPAGSPKGTVTVQLYVDSAGNVIKDSVKIVQSLNKACDWEALRVIKKSPKWNPAGPGGNAPIRIPIKIN